MVWRQAKKNVRDREVGCSRAGGRARRYLYCCLRTSTPPWESTLIQTSARLVQERLSQVSSRSQPCLRRMQLICPFLSALMHLSCTLRLCPAPKPCMHQACLVQPLFPASQAPPKVERKLGKEQGKGRAEGRTVRQMGGLPLRDIDSVTWLEHVLPIFLRWTSTKRQRWPKEARTSRPSKGKKEKIPRLPLRIELPNTQAITTITPQLFACPSQHQQLYSSWCDAQ